VKFWNSVFDLNKQEDALSAYNMANNDFLPSYVICYRGGVGESQLRDMKDVIISFVVFNVFIL
jgi:hypothetical protein